MDADASVYANSSVDADVKDVNKNRWDGNVDRMNRVNRVNSNVNVDWEGICGKVKANKMK